MLDLGDLFRQEAERIAARDFGVIKSCDVRTLDLLEKLYPTYQRPEHLMPMVELYEQAWEQSTFGTMHAPPQHGKTTLTSVFAIATLLRNPTARIVYASYEAKRAWRVSAEIRKKAIEAGVELDEAVAAKDAWQTAQGGQFIATGVGGPLTGEPADIVLIDDPYKNRSDALSVAYQEKVFDWFRDVVESRTHKTSSIFVHHTRWHAGDLIGWIQNDPHHRHYQDVRLPAILEDGSLLWPHKHDKEELERRRAADPDQFEGYYQGRPPLDVGAIFSLPTYGPADYPKMGRVGIGMDAAYTAKTRGDSCAIVVLREVMTYDEPGGRPRDPYYVVEHAERARVPLERFETTLREIGDRFPGVRIQWSGSSIEKEIARRLDNKGIWLSFQVAVNDKYVRSEPVAMAWRLGNIRIPEGAPWAADFVQQVTGFTGVEGRPDDYVDALSDAYAALGGGDAGWLSGWAPRPAADR